MCISEVTALCHLPDGYVGMWAGGHAVLEVRGSVVMITGGR